MDEGADLGRHGSTQSDIEEACQSNADAQKGELERLVSRAPPEPDTQLEAFREDGLTEQEAAERLERYGPNSLPSTEVPAWKQILSLMAQPMALMMWVAALIEFLIENYPDMGILLGIIITNASISFYETRKSGNAVKELQNKMKPKALVKRDGNPWTQIDAEMLVPGDTVSLRAGSAVPADCRVHAGVITVDQAALTGESLPVTIDGHKDDDVYPLMGTTVMTGEVEATVQRTGVHTKLGRTAQLLDGPAEKSNLDRVLFKIVMVMAGLSVVLSLVVFAFGLAKMEEHHLEFKAVLSFTVVLIVASIPMAVEIVTTTTLALGARKLAKDGGAIVTRLSSVEDMASMNMLCSDKTGTLTLNKMELTTDVDLEKRAIFQQGVTREQILQWAAMATKWKEPAGDALDKLVHNAADLDELNREGEYHQPKEQFIPFNPKDKFTQATIVRKDGTKLKVQKGAPDVVIGLCEKSLGADLSDARAMQEEMAARGIRCLAVAISAGDSENWKLQGMLTFLDPPRPDSKDTIQKAKELGVPVRMITGDHVLIAKETCNQLGLQGESTLGPDSLPQLDEDGNAPNKDQAAPENPDGAGTVGELIDNADAFAQVFPDHKYIIVDVLRQLGYKCGMTGDGVNDAPAMKRADVGVCVQGGTDAARAAADIVLTQEGLSTIVDAIKLAREIFARINNFMSYRLAASMQLLFYFFIAVLTIHPSEYAGTKQAEGCKEISSSPSGVDQANSCFPYMYSMPVLLLMLITLLNDGALITIGYDNVRGAQKPTVWNIRMLFVVAFVMAAVACASSLLLLHLALDSGNPDSAFKVVGLQEMAWGHITTMMYLKVSISDFLTLFSCRAGERYWWDSAPAPIVAAAAFIALSSSTVIACVYPETTLDGLSVVGLMRKGPRDEDVAPDWTLTLWVWVYCIVWWFFQDFCKVMVYKVCRARGWFGAEPPEDAPAWGDGTDYQPLEDTTTLLATV